MRIDFEINGATADEIWEQGNKIARKFFNSDDFRLAVVVAKPEVVEHTNDSTAVNITLWSAQLEAWSEVTENKERDENE